MSEVEYKMLCEFYESWEAFHEIPNDHLHRNKKRSAAQVMVDAAKTIRRYRQPSQIAEILNG